MYFINLKCYGWKYISFITYQFNISIKKVRENINSCIGNKDDKDDDNEDDDDEDDDDEDDEEDGDDDDNDGDEE